MVPKQNFWEGRAWDRRQSSRRWAAEILDRYCRPKELLHESVGEHWGADFLEHKLIAECEEARKAVDVHESERAKARRARDQAPEVADAARRIARYLRDFPRESRYVLEEIPERGVQAIIRTGQYGLDAKGWSYFRPDEVWMTSTELLERFCEQLAICIVAHDRSNFHVSARARAGAIYDEPIDARTHRKPPSRGTILAFHLVWWLRSVTNAPVRVYIHDFAGAAMPTGGKPHYRVAEEFVAAATGERFDVRRRLTEHKKMQMYKWD